MSLLRLARPRLLQTCSRIQPAPLCTRIQHSPLRAFSLTTSRLDTPTTSQPSSAAPPTDPKAYIQSLLKNAMRAKDTPRLNVLRSLLASITNASKTSSPITTPTHLYNLLSKQISASERAVAEFEIAKRDDLVRKEKEQIEILESYRSGIESLKSEDIDGILEKIMVEVKDKGAKFGDVMKEVQKVIAGKPHDSQYLVDKIKSLMGTK